MVLRWCRQTSGASHGKMVMAKKVILNSNGWAYRHQEIWCLMMDIFAWNLEYASNHLQIARLAVFVGSGCTAQLGARSQIESMIRRRIPKADHTHEALA